MIQFLLSVWMFMYLDNVWTEAVIRHELKNGPKACATRFKKGVSRHKLRP